MLIIDKLLQYISTNHLVLQYWLNNDGKSPVILLQIVSYLIFQTKKIAYSASLPLHTIRSFILGLE